MSNLDSIDLDFSWNGDYLIGHDGDLLDTSDDLLRSLVNEIQTIVKSDFGDWLKQPNLGAGLNDFKGEGNTRDTGNKIKQRLVTKLTANNLLRQSDLQIKITPVHTHQVLIMIRVQADATAGNHLQAGQPVIVNLIYDSSEGAIFYLPENQIKRNNKSL